MAEIINNENVVTEEDLSEQMIIRREKLKALQDECRFTELMMLQEELKMLPVGDIWNEFCSRNGTVGTAEWYNAVADYEKNVLAKR